MTAEQLARDLLEAGLKLLESTGEATGGDPQRLTAGDLVTLANMIRGHSDHIAVERMELRRTLKANETRIDALERSVEFWQGKVAEAKDVQAGLALAVRYLAVKLGEAEAER